MYQSVKIWMFGQIEIDLETESISDELNALGLVEIELEKQTMYL